jgi:hypothetical protein
MADIVWLVATIAVSVYLGINLAKLLARALLG